MAIGLGPAARASAPDDGQCACSYFPEPFAAGAALAAPAQVLYREGVR